MAKNFCTTNPSVSVFGHPSGNRFPVVLGLSLLILALICSDLSFAAIPAPEPIPGSGKVLEELQYQVDVWIWRDALQAKVKLLEVGPGRYRAEIDGRTQGLLSILTGNWGGQLFTEMEYFQGKLRPLVYREVGLRKGKKRTMEYHFNYAQNKVVLWKIDEHGTKAKRWETDLTGPMYDPLTFFYNRRLTGNPIGERGGEIVKIQGIPYPKPEDITLRLGDRTSEGRKIMVELGDRLHKGERSQVYAYLDADGVPTKAWTQVMRFGNVDIKLLPGGKRLKKEEVMGAPVLIRVGETCDGQTTP